ncbi:hypothetical protein K439DRAFT_1349209 [Ramaria rubella]|nr:hypothetical protein K439DRAFT_1349209 [Ramaria rubella]
MPKATKNAFYAVHIGQQPGTYATWADCEQQIKGYPKAQYKKFFTEAEANAFVKFGSAGGHVAAAAAGNFASSAISSPTKAMDKTTYMTKKLGKQNAGGVVDEAGWDVVYTDGACQGNGKAGAIAGIGVWWGTNDPRNFAERCPGDQTNNRAELIAIIRVLETASQNIKRLLIKTDSSYSISCVRDWIPSWQKRGWKTADGKDVKNKPVIIYLSHLLNQRGGQGQIVQIQHVRGHVGIAGNEGADRLAGAGALMPATRERDWTLPKEEILSTKEPPPKEEVTKDSENDTVAEFQVR